MAALPDGAYVRKDAREEGKGALEGDAEALSSHLEPSSGSINPLVPRGKKKRKVQKNL